MSGKKYDQKINLRNNSAYGICNNSHPHVIANPMNCFLIWNTKGYILKMSCLFFFSKKESISIKGIVQLKLKIAIHSPLCRFCTVACCIYCTIWCKLFHLAILMSHNIVSSIQFSVNQNQLCYLLSVYIIPWVQKHVQQHHDFFHVSVQNVCYFENCHGLLFVFFFSPHCRQTFSRRLLAKYERCLSSYSECWWTRSQTVVNVAWLCCFCPLSHFQEESPLSVSSPDSIGTWIHYTCGVGTGRRRRRSGDQITSSPVSPKSLAFTSSIFGSWQQVFTNLIHSSHQPLTYCSFTLKSLAAVSKDT